MRYKTALAAAQAYAKANGIEGRTGGWLYDHEGTRLIRGWGEFIEWLTHHKIIRAEGDGFVLGQKEQPMLEDKLPIDLARIKEEVKGARDENLLKIAALAIGELKRRHLSLPDEGLESWV